MAARQQTGHETASASHGGGTDLRRGQAVGVLPAATGHLAHKKQRPPRNLQQDCAKGPVVALGGVAVSFERGIPVQQAARIPWAK